MTRQFLSTLSAAASMLTAHSQNWPQSRGPNASGIADKAHPPVEFGPDKSLLWKSAAPPSVSSPIVWGNRVFLTGFAGNQLLTLAYDAQTGHELWRRVAPAEKIEQCHEFSAPAGAKPCTEGEH